MGAVASDTAPARLRARTLLLFTAVVGLFVTSCSLHRTTDSTLPSSTSMPPPPEVNIAYGPDTGCPGPTQDPCAGSQTLDIYRATGITPATATSGPPRKVVVWIHGGGFVAADKTGSMSKYFKGLLDDGWDIVAINYRLARPNRKNLFPTGIRDVKRAVRWVKANAATHGWDPTRVAAMGHSAGGNLAEMLATTADEPELEDPDLPAELAAVDSSVASAVSLAGVSDMRGFRDSGLFTQVVAEYLGCSQNCDLLLDAASVQTHVDAASAPILALHGALDPVAAPAQGKLVRAAYERAGIGDRFKLIIVNNGPKDFQGHVPDMRRWIGDVVRWFDDHLPPAAQN